MCGYGGLFSMNGTSDPRYNTGDSLKDVWHFLCDAKYAIFPADVAHRVGEFEKNFWGGVRWFAEKNLEWLDEALAGGDRLREEWRRKCDARQAATAAGATP